VLSVLNRKNQLNCHQVVIKHTKAKVIFIADFLFFKKIKAPMQKNKIALVIGGTEKMEIDVILII